MPPAGRKKAADPPTAQSAPAIAAQAAAAEPIAPAIALDSVARAEGATRTASLRLACVFGLDWRSWLSFSYLVPYDSVTILRNPRLPSAWRVGALVGTST